MRQMSLTGRLAHRLHEQGMGALILAPPISPHVRDQEPRGHAVEATLRMREGGFRVGSASLRRAARTGKGP